MKKVRVPFRRLLFITSAAGLTLMMNACAQFPDYSVGFVNKTGHDLDRVSAYYGNDSNKIWALPVWIVAHGCKTENLIPLPIPQEAEVRVIDNGVQKSFLLNLSSVPKRGFEDGTIYFIINTNDSVEVKPVRFGDAAATTEVMKGLIPKGEYRVCFVNKTGRSIEAISVSADGTKLLEHPTLFGGAFTESGYLDPPVPPETELQWTEGGAPHVVKVKLSDVPKGFEGLIYFVIKADDTVEVHPVKSGDDKTASELVK